jgi:Flp pilus assembly protein TadD
VALAAQDKLPDALTELGEVPLARSSGNSVYLLGVLSLRAGRHAEAIRALSWVRDNPNPTDVSPTHGAVRYLLARAYDEAKRPAEARAAYQAFLDFWKDADPALPVVVDARTRLAQLGT